jgi:hypothetical protein
MIFLERMIGGGKDAHIVGYELNGMPVSMYAHIE